jgi:hypothetical protein
MPVPGVGDFFFRIRNSGMFIIGFLLSIGPSAAIWHFGPRSCEAQRRGFSLAYWAPRSELCGSQAHEALPPVSWRQLHVLCTAATPRVMGY